MEELKENYIEEKMLGFFYFLLEAATSIISKKNPDVWNIHTIIFGQVMVGISFQICSIFGFFLRNKYQIIIGIIDTKGLTCYFHDLE